MGFMPSQFTHSRIGRSFAALGAALAMLLTTIGLTAAPAQANVPTCTAAGITVTQMHGANRPFYISAPDLRSGSVGWKFSGGLAETEPNLWVSIGGFSSADLALNAAQPNRFPVVGKSSDGKPLAYAYLTAAREVATAQTWTVGLWDGDPTLGTSSPICTYADGVSRTYDVTVAAANKPDTVTVSGTPVVGGRFTMTVTGSTGTIGAGLAADPRVLALSPSMGNDWPAGSYQLIGATTTFGSGTISSAPDELRVNFPSGDTSNRTYSTVYTFYVRGSVATAVTPVPRQSIASGSLAKISSPSVSAQAIPATVLPGSDGSLTQTISSSTDWTNKQVGYTVTYRNTSAQPVCFDSLEVDPTDSAGPDGWTYVNGSSTFNGGLSDDPAVVAGPPKHLMLQAFCVPGGTAENPGTTTFTFTIGFTSSLSISPRTTIGDVDVMSTTSPSASLTVNVKSTTFNENYDGVEVALSRNGGPFTYKTGVTDANGSVNLGAVDPNSSYQVKLKAPCDNRPEETETAFDVTTGASSQDYTLVATVPCAPALTYRPGDDTVAWTHPNDGGSRIRLYTLHYNTPARINKNQPWGIFARNWPADLNEVPLAIYGPKTGPCPARSTNSSPLPFNVNPECLRPAGEPPRGENVRYRVTARNAVASAGATENNGAGWGPYSPVHIGKRPVS